MSCSLHGPLLIWWCSLDVSLLTIASTRCKSCFYFFLTWGRFKVGRVSVELRSTDQTRLNYINDYCIRISRSTSLRLNDPSDSTMCDLENVGGRVIDVSMWILRFIKCCIIILVQGNIISDAQRQIGLFNNVNPEKTVTKKKMAYVSKVMTPKPD